VGITRENNLSSGPQTAEAALNGGWKFAKEESTVDSNSDLWLLMRLTHLNCLHQAHEGHHYSANPPREIEIFTQQNKFVVRRLKV
jgi:hypothetical protein